MNNKLYIYVYCRIFHALHQANSLCHNTNRTTRYGIHVDHKNTELDFEFWDSAKLLIKTHKKKRVEQLQEEAAHGLMMGANADAMNGVNDVLLRHHRKLLLSGCGKRLYGLYIDEIKYNNDQLHHIQHLEHTDHYHTNAQVSSVVRCISWDKFVKNVVPGLKKNTPGSSGNASGNGGGPTIVGEAPVDDEKTSNSRHGHGSHGHGHGEDDIDNADYNYYVKHVMNHTNTNANSDGNGSNAGASAASAPRETELILLSIAEQFLFARKHLNEIQMSRGWN